MGTVGYCTFCATLFIGALSVTSLACCTFGIEAAWFYGPEQDNGYIPRWPRFVE